MRSVQHQSPGSETTAPPGAGGAVAGAREREKRVNWWSISVLVLMIAVSIGGFAYILHNWQPLVMSIDGENVSYDEVVLKAREGDTKPALDYFRELEARNMIGAPQVSDWIQVLSWAQKYREAVKCYDRYRVTYDIPVEGLAAAARSYRKLGDYDHALMVWDALRQVDRDSEVYLLEQIGTLADAGHTDEALEKAKGYAAASPGLEAREILAYVERKSRPQPAARDDGADPVAALERFRKFEQSGYPLSRENVADWIRYANWAGLDDEAVAVYDRFRAYDVPVDGKVAAARSFRTLRNYPRSLALWDEIRRSEPEEEDYALNQMATMVDAGYYEEVIPLARAAYQIYADSETREVLVYAEQARYDAVIRLARDGQHDVALDMFHTMALDGLSLSDGQVSDWLVIANWAGLDQEVMDVLDHYGPDRELEPEALAAAARSYRNAKKWTEALDLWDRALKAEPENDSFERGRIATLADAGRIQEAAAALKKLKERTSDDESDLEAYLERRAGKAGPGGGEVDDGPPAVTKPDAASVPPEKTGDAGALTAKTGIASTAGVPPAPAGGNSPDGAGSATDTDSPEPGAKKSGARPRPSGSGKTAVTPGDVDRSVVSATGSGASRSSVAVSGTSSAARPASGSARDRNVAPASGSGARTAAAVPAGTDYDSLVRMAREGQHGPVLAWLRTADANGTLTKSQIVDRVVIAGWANDSQTVREVYQRYKGHDFPAGAHAAAARAFRDSREWTRSLEAWEAALKKAPKDRGLQMGYIYTLADSGRDDRALPLALGMLKTRPDAISYAVLAYVHRAAYHTFGTVSRLFDSFEAATEANELDPNIRDVQQIYVGSMQLSRVSAPAFIESGRPPHAINAAGRRQLMSDVASELVRLPPSGAESERFNTPDKALALYDRMFAAWADVPEARDLLVNLRQDYIGALHNRSFMKEATDEYEALVAGGVAVNDQVLFWVAGAYLYQRMPEKAVVLYETLASRGPKVLGESRYFDANVGLFNALSENNQHYRAREVAEKFRDYYRPFITPLGSGVEIPNNEWFFAQEVWGSSLQSSDYLPEAQEFYESLLRTAPTSQGLRTSLAVVYASRGWPRRSEEELKIAESLEPTNLGLMVQQGYTALELQEWDQLDQIADDVITRYPESLEARRLDRLRQVHHMAELRVTGYRGFYNDNNSPVTGSNDWGFDTVLYSPPFHDNWRVFGGGGYRRGKFQEGYAYQRTLRAGVEYRTRDNWLELEMAHHDYKADDSFAFRASAWHDFNDHWRFGATGETLAARTPLRALNSGIKAGGFDTWVRWYDSERREWTLGMAPLWFTDGNFRMEYALTGKERLITDPYFTLDLRPDISMSHNSKSDVPYWSPEMEFGATPGLDARHVLYRRYQTIWSHTLAGGIGPYWQKGHGWDWSAFVTYGHRLQWNDVLDAGAYVTYRNRPYDGVREQEVQGTFDINYRF